MICLVKRSQALRGRNLTRDSQADGAPMVHRALGRSRGLGPPFGTTATEHTLWHHSDTGAMPQKIPGSGAEPQGPPAHAQTLQKTLNDRDSKPLKKRERSHPSQNLL